MKKNNKHVLSVVLFALSTWVRAENSKPDITTQPFTVELKASRIIFDPTTNGSSLAVVNPQGYPVLIQSIVMNEDMKSKAPFIVTPPLIRLDARQQNRLRIINTTTNFPGDRESLYWVCVKGIPPSNDDLWAGDTPVVKNKTSVNVRLSVNNCIKLFVRPQKLSATGDVAKSLTWRYQGKQLTAVNTSPFYINLAELKAGTVNVEKINYIPPFGEQSFVIPDSQYVHDIQWRVINDYGGISPIYRTSVQ